MPHKMSWLIEKRVLQIEYDGLVDKAEVQFINAELDRYLNEGIHPVHILSDNTKMEKVELTVSLARESFTAMKRPGWGWVIVIGMPRLVRFFAEVFATQFGVKIKIALDADEAMQILKKQDLSLAEDAKS